MNCGYKIWCGDHDTMSVVENRLTDHGYSWFSGRPSTLIGRHDSIGLFFGDERQPYKRNELSYSDGRSYFIQDAAKEVKYNDLTDEFLYNVIQSDRRTL